MENEHREESELPGLTDASDRLPSWIDKVPMSATKKLQVEVGPNVFFPLELLSAGLDLPVRSSTGSFSVVPELQHELQQYTENPAWGNLPTQTTWIERVDETTWLLQLGDDYYAISGEEIAHIIAEHTPDTPTD